MVSAISTLGSAYSVSAYSTGTSGSNADVLRLEKAVDAKQGEVDECQCADTKPRLQAELRNLQAELTSAKAEESATNPEKGATDRQSVSASDASNDNRSFSGESDRIGTINFDETTPFGERVAYM